VEGSNLIQFLTYAAMMASAVFIPIIAQNYGASPGMIGLVVGIYNAAFLLSSYSFGLLTDRYGGKYPLRIGLLIATVFFASQVFTKDINSLLIVRCLAGAAAGIFPAALAVYAYHEHHGKMGKFTGYGSLGWAIGALIAGLIATNQTNIFLAAAIFFLAAFLVSLQMDFSFHKPPGALLVPWRLVKRNLRIYLPYFFRSVGAQTTWAIFPLYLAFTGADMLWIGIAYFINTGSQFFIMQWVEKYRNLLLFNIGLLCSVITFIGYALFPHLPVVLALQLLLAFSFSTLAVGAVQELLGKNIEQSTAISVLNSIANLTAVVGPFIAGILLELYGFAGVMWFGALASFVGLISFTTVLE